MSYQDALVLLANNRNQRLAHEAVAREPVAWNISLALEALIPQIQSDAHELRQRLDRIERILQARR